MRKQDPQNGFIKLLIERAGGSQEKLAAIAGVKQSSVHKWLYSDCQPSAHAAQKIAAAGLATLNQIRPDIYR